MAIFLIFFSLILQLGCVWKDWHVARHQFSPFFLSLSLLDSLLPWPSDRGESLPILSNHGRFIFYTALWLLSIIPHWKKKKLLLLLLHFLPCCATFAISYIKKKNKNKRLSSSNSSADLYGNGWCFFSVCCVSWAPVERDGWPYTVREKNTK